MNIQNILKSTPLKILINNLFTNKKLEIVKRSACFFIKIKNERGDKLKRIILLPPHGYTANRINEMNPHPEVRTAKIIIYGAVRSNKSGFSLLNHSIKFVYSTERNPVTKKDRPYVQINLSRNNQKQINKGAKDKFFAVKENGVGFYHNLVNLTTDWMVLVLEKNLRLVKKVDLNSKIKKINKRSKFLIKNLFNKIEVYGDNIFKKEGLLINKVLKLNENAIMPAFIEMLNIHETGKHEPCTVFALILKIGRKNKKEAINYLKKALKNNDAPKYYLEELIKKLVNLEN